MIKRILLLILLSSFLTSPVYAFNWCTTDGDIVLCHTMNVDENPLQDISANNEDINLKGAGEPDFITPAKYDGGYSWDGVNDYARTTNKIDLTGTNIITITFWLYWDSFADNDDIAMEHSENFNQYGNYPAYLIIPNDSANSQFSVLLHSGSGYRGEGMTRKGEGEWHHYAIVLDNTTSNGDIKIYYDGSLESTDINNNNATGTDNFTNEYIYIMNRGNLSLFGAGDMDELAMFSSEKDNTDINSMLLGLTSQVEVAPPITVIRNAILRNAIIR